MATQKQIEANRRNAKKSTGPRTAAGKARAAQNARKHGLLSRQVVLADESAEEFAEMRRWLHHDLQPGSELEVLLVNRIAAQQWRLARIPALEAQIFDRLRVDALGDDAGLGGAWTRDAGPYGGELARLARYETALERSVVRLLAELRRIQAERRRREEAEAEALPAWDSARPPAREELHAAATARGAPNGRGPAPRPDGDGGAAPVPPPPGAAPWQDAVPGA